MIRVARNYDLLRLKHPTVGVAAMPDALTPARPFEAAGDPLRSTQAFCSSYTGHFRILADRWKRPSAVSRGAALTFHLTVRIMLKSHG